MHKDVNISAFKAVGLAPDNLIESLEKIAQWGIDRNITAEGGATALSQIKKLKEEVNELEQALINNDIPEVIDGIGDSLTVIVQIARLAGYSLEDCAFQAWLEIKDRKGTMIDGVFVKEQ